MPTDCNIDWNFIRHLEGFSKTGYVPQGGHSGVTVCAGFDIGQRDKSGLYVLGLSIPLLTKLMPYVNLQGQTARDALSKQPLELTGEEANELDAKVREVYASAVEKEYNENSDFTFCMLDGKKQTVIMSVGFQYGSLKKKCPTFFSLIIKGLWSGAVKELQNFGDSYQSRRLKEAELLKSSIIT